MLIGFRLSGSVPAYKGSPAGADSGDVVEVLVFLWIVSANQGRSCLYLCALDIHLTNRNKKNTKMSLVPKQIV